MGIGVFRRASVPGMTEAVMLPRAALLALAAFVATPAVAGGPADTAGRVDDLTVLAATWVDAFARTQDLNGVVLAARGDHILLHRAYGLANREWSVPNGPDTRFHIASVTKPITAAAVLTLAERGELRLEDTVADHVPWYRSDTGRRVTIHHLLSHTSGIPNFAGREFWEGPAPRLDYERREFLEQFASGDLLFEPGSAAQYSDANYLLLATIVENVTGETFGGALARLIFRPAGMTDSEAASHDVVHLRTASSYMSRADELRRPDFINYADVQRGAGDVISTAPDLFRFVGALRSGAILTPEMRDRMFAPLAASGFEGQNQGYGWNLGTLETEDGKGIAFAQAPGNNGGFNALLYLLPESETVIAVLMNAGTPWLDGRLFTVAESLARILHGENVPLPRPSVVSVVRQIMETGVNSDLASVFSALAASGAFDPDPGGANRLGYELLRSGEVDRAIRLFEAITETFPASSNAHDSLAEAYWVGRRYEASLANYRRSVELNPRNENGLRMIGILEKEIAATGR